MKYFDTSALIKRFIDESGSDAVDRLLDEDPLAATSKVAYAEVHASLARRLRASDLSRTTFGTVSASFERDWRMIRHVEVSDSVLYLTRELVRRNPLRGFDAIHLASAIRMRDQLGEQIQFVAADARLLAAAASEDLESVDVRA
jgi:predicted nucleic acid-binding protein